MREIEELKKRIKDLESELAASIKREELKRAVGSDGGSFKQKIKNKIKSTRVWRAADDPNDRLGKIIRLPRSIARIVTNPNVAKDIREKNRHIKMSSKNARDIFMPIRFFISENGGKRINVVLEREDLDLMKMGVFLANQEDVELRVISTKGIIDGVWYRKMVKEKQLPSFNKISFYNTLEQNIRAKTFELEVSKEDIFLTKAWINDGRK